MPVNSAGLVISETTIAYAAGFDVNGIPEFIRMRKAAQYADSIDKFSTIMRTGNNGGYANTWLIGDTRTNEIAKLELGLKNTALFRSQDGYFDGMNYVDNSKMIREECSPSLWDTNGKLALRPARREFVQRQAAAVDPASRFAKGPGQRCHSPGEPGGPGRSLHRGGDAGRICPHAEA